MLDLPTDADPREMRKAIEEMASGRFDPSRGLNRPLASDALVRNVLMAAKYRGYSGEDTMTMLAYTLLQQNAQLFEDLLNLHRISPPRPIIMERGELRPQPQPAAPASPA